MWVNVCLVYKHSDLIVTAPRVIVRRMCCTSLVWIYLHLKMTLSTSLLVSSHNMFPCAVFTFSVVNSVN